MAKSLKNLQIELLADHPQTIPILKEWFEQEWAPYYCPTGPGDAQTDLRNSCNGETLPITLIAITDGEICGTAALKSESVSTHNKDIYKNSKGTGHVSVKGYRNADHPASAKSNESKTPVSLFDIHRLSSRR